MPDYKEDKKKLEEILNKFQDVVGLAPLMAIEQEFYVSGDVPDNFMEELGKFLVKKTLLVEEVKDEKGKNQFEVTLPASYNIPELADAVIFLREKTEIFAKEHNLKTYFDAKPFENEPGSSMHVHISLYDNKKNNVLQKNDEDEESGIMLHAIAGLLKLIPSSMKHFAPFEDSYKRYEESPITPSTISWGGNNRTVALRLPATTMFEFMRRVENRLPSSDSNPYKVFSCILLGVMHGIEHKLTPEIPKIHGNAYLEIYGMERLPGSLSDAKKILDNIIDSNV